MRSPTSFALAYLPHRKLGEELAKLAGPRLELDVCKDNKWLFTARVKSEESALAKIQLGPVRSLSDMPDLYGATIVVPTKAEVSEAVACVSDMFPGAQVLPRRRPEAQRFIYDDTHVFAYLGAHASGLAPAVQERKFEIQIKSGLQYAWWRATHDVLYKGAERSWQVSRVAHQVRAALELLDTQLGDLRAAADLVGPLPPDDADEDFASIAGWLARWDDEDRPADISRFVRSVQDIMQAARIRSPDELGALLEEPTGAALVADQNVTPFQAVLGAAVTKKGPGIIDQLRKERYVLITDELRSAAPATADVADARRARLE